MPISLKSSATLLCALTFYSAAALAGSPADFFEVVAVTPSNVIQHEVNVKGTFDNDAIETFLEGPQQFSHAVGFGENPVKGQGAFLNWYKIVKPAAEPRRILSVRDSLRGKDAQRIIIENSAFLLSPAQRITTGPPSQIPAGLNYFKAYKIVDASGISQKVKLTGTFGPENRTTVKAIFFCVPVERRHHDDHVPIKDSHACMIVYELLPQKCKVSVTTIDLFGLNTLVARSGKWICVPARIVERLPADAK